MSLSSVGRIIDHRARTGNARVPRQGQGKKDDPRWVYSGPRGPGNLLALERVMEAGDATDLIKETHERAGPLIEATRRTRPPRGSCARSSTTPRKWYASCRSMDARAGLAGQSGGARERTL